MDNILLEQDLEPISADQPTDTGKLIDSLDLEEITGNEGEDAEGEGDDYQYTLTVKQAEDAEGDKSLEPEFTFILTPKEAEGAEAEGDLESIEDTSADIENTQAPAASVAAPPAAPLPESFLSDLEPITEQEAVLGANGGDNTTPPAPEAAVPPAGEEQPLPEEEPVLEETTIELSQEDLKSFVESSEMEVKFSIDEETEFNIDEAMDYLKLYPDTEVFVKVIGDLEEFKTKLEEFTAEQEAGLDTAATEEQNVMVDNEGETLDMKNTPQANPASPQVSNEAFSVFNFRGKKNLPDGIYVAHLLENKLYGRIDLKLTPNKLMIGKDIFSLDNQLNITEAKGKESIELFIKEEDVNKLVDVLKMKADITVNLNKE